MKNQPKTIADLDFNWIFTIEDRRFVYWELDFYWKNPCIENHKIKPENYVFEIVIRDKILRFSILINENVRLRELMYLIHNNIRRVYNEEFAIEGACFRLIKFKETVFSNVFIIKVEEI